MQDFINCVLDLIENSYEFRAAGKHVAGDVDEISACDLDLIQRLKIAGNGTVENLLELALRFIKAIQGALKMVEVLEEWNAEREKEGKHRIEMGFGIHTGLVLVGNMGAENRLNYTVIGGNVNFASRLCSAAEGMEILISKETLAEPHVQETVNVEECPPIKVKGYDEPFIVYRVKGSK